MKGFPGDWVGVVDSTRKKVSRNWQSVLVFGKIGSLVSGIRFLSGEEEKEVNERYGIK